MEESAYHAPYDYLFGCMDNYKQSYQTSDDKFIPLREVRKEQKNQEKQEAIQDRLARVRFWLYSAIGLLSDEHIELSYDESASLTPLSESALQWFHGNKVAVQEPVEVSNYLLRYPDFLADFYVFDNPQEIEDFLLANSDLADVLLSGVPYIIQSFGDVLKHLEYYRDLDERTGELVIIIQSRFETEENMQRQNKLITEWFAKLPRRIRGKLSIEIEPISAGAHDTPHWTAQI
jgi:hypothetical protein